MTLCLDCISLFPLNMQTIKTQKGQTWRCHARGAPIGRHRGRMRLGALLSPAARPPTHACPAHGDVQGSWFAACCIRSEFTWSHGDLQPRERWSAATQLGAGVPSSPTRHSSGSSDIGCSSSSITRRSRSSIACLAPTRRAGRRPERIHRRTVSGFKINAIEMGVSLSPAAATLKLGERHPIAHDELMRLERAR